ncbi:helix-turn-helix transcriptional regulator [Cohnella nanjingensis]|uniref:YafY family transcriptional regulator n=1 Tax=Cohnella nanjingensis TaxID=1387779 RepID=A0A7X0VDQ2_9BACL|nr:YafY family protein [Cohnella nanjingensis]MBB6670192.1 YafY family transcriptional regulator [Cohnella nanjingensis]
MKLDRLLSIVMLLLGRNRINATELSERLQVSLRTIYRDVETLVQAGLPIVSYAGTDGGFELQDDWRMNRRTLTLGELTAIATSLRSLQSAPALSAENVDGLLEQVGTLAAQAGRDGGAGAESERILIDLKPWRSSKSDRDKYDRLHQAVLEQRLVRFAYTDGQGDGTERTAEPMGLAHKGYAWYLYAYCRTRDDYRIFRLSRIHALQTLEETFERRPETISQLNGRWDALPQTETVELTLRFANAAKARAEDQFEEAQIERQPDGSLVVRAALPEGEWLTGFLLSFREDLRVLAPARIAEAVRANALRVAEQYASP